MLITLIGKNFINRLTLPKIKMGNYWLYDKDYNRNMLKITNKSDNWILMSTPKYQIINPKNIIADDGKIGIYRDGNEILKDIKLENYNFYYVTIENSLNIYIIYCSPAYKDDYKHLKISNTNNFSYEISIGRNIINNHISYNNPLMCDKHAKITFLNGRYLIENYDKKFNIFVNDRPVSNSTVTVFNGDKITIYGLNIILVGNEIFINNPLNQVSYDKKKFEIFINNDKNLNLEDEEDFEQYVDNEYFFKKPRILNPINQDEIKIKEPQVSEKKRELPTALVLASSLSMGLITAINLIRTIINVSSGETELENAIFNIILSIVMLITAVLIPIISKFYNKKIKKLNEKDTAENYKNYIRRTVIKIDDLLNNNRKILNENYPSADECVNIILKKQPRLWERQISDTDFLTVRLGIGDISSGLKIADVEDSAKERTDELYKLQDECIARAKTLKNAPVLLSLMDKNISAILYQDKKIEYKYIQDLLIQLVTFQSYDELKLIFLLKNNPEKEWDFVKLFPHIWNNAKDTRFFADTLEKISEITQYLEKEITKRTKEKEDKTNSSNKPYYLIIIDDYKNVENFGIINEILKSPTNLGCSILFITNNMQKLPNNCQTIIDIKGNEGTVFDSQKVDESTVKFSINISNTFFFDKICQILSNILIKNDDEKEMMLPTHYTFLEMYNVGNIEQLQILDRWKQSDSTTSLAAPLGVNGSGELLSLDIHEKYHGPHGLIAGSTGSGKSEFIITYILSLAINFHPDDVTFVLIDYKGGGLAGAFERENVQLPHLVGTITNIDKTNLQRSLESIESELKKRQVEFNEAKNITNEGTMDIYKYQKYYHEGVLKKPISHLLIISDEFAELKQQEPEFMDELISVARIGRSLGVHLILATQRPAGVVTDQIRSNTKFGVCLKVQSPSDSKDVINMPDAAKLKNAGQFYLKVGNDDYLALGQSAYAGALYYPSDEVKKNFDNAIEFVSDTGKIFKKVDDIKKNNTKDEGEQLTNIVQYLCDLAKEQNIHEEPLWLTPIPETIYLKDIREKYKVKEDENTINPVIGEYDDPSKQLQNVMRLNLYSEGNIIVYGNATSGKETLLSTMIYDVINNYSSEKINMYILDFGSETMKIFKGSNHVGDVVFASEGEKIARFFMMMQKELRERKEKLSEYNGSYELYLKNTNEIMPTYNIIINNYEAFVENCKGAYDDALEILLREGIKYKITFLVITGSATGIRYKMLQNFKQKIALRMNKDDDYGAIFERVRKKRPSNLFGRGLVCLEPQKYFEFQTAKICKDDEWNEEILETIKKRNEAETYKAKPVAVMPDIVTVNEIMPYIKDLSTVPIGIANKNIEPYLMNFKNILNIIATTRLEDFKDFINTLVDVLRLMENVDFHIFDAENILSKKEEDDDDDDDDKNQKVINDYISIFKILNNSKKIKENVFIIVGLDKFITKLESDELFYESMKNAKQLKKCYYIILDSVTKLNAHVQTEWYKKFATGDTGLWLGNNVGSQYLLKPTTTGYKLVNMCGDSFGYAIVKGTPSLIKLLGMKEKKKEDE